MRQYRKELSLFLLVSAMFALTFFPGKPLGSFHAEADHSYVTLNNYSLSFLSFWKAKGLLGSGLRLGIPNHYSDPEVVGTYPSYPSTYLLPAYFVVKALKPQGELSPEGEMTVLRLLAAAGHFLLVLCCAFSVFILSTSFTAALLSAALASFSPPLLLWQHNLWWPDFVGLSLVSVLCLLQALYAKERLTGTRADVVFGLACFLACLTDWFAFPLVGAFLLVGSARRRLHALAGGGAALLALALKIANDGSYEGLVFKFGLRSGLQVYDQNSPNVLYRLQVWLERAWQSYLGWSLAAAVIVIAGSFLFRKQTKASRMVMIPLSLALLAHWLVTNEHYANHGYVAVRWAYFIAMSPALLPGIWSAAAGAFLLASLLASGSSILYREFYRQAYVSPLAGQEIRDACALVDSNRKKGRAFLVAEGEAAFGAPNRDLIEIFALCRDIVTQVPPPMHKQQSSREFLATHLIGGVEPPPAEIAVLVRTGSKVSHLRASELFAERGSWKLYRMNEREKTSLLTPP